jgi:hypothetical protein
MIKIGIIGSNKSLLQVTDLIKAFGDIELTGCYDEDYNKAKEFSLPQNIIPYPTLESFFRYVDAVVLTHDLTSDILPIATCLKNFKHVFLLGAQYLKYPDFIYLEKIAAESNVILFPEFESHSANFQEALSDYINDVQFIEVTHTFPVTEEYCLSGRFSSSLICNLVLLTDLIRANVKRINANAWDFTESGAGMLNARIDFDNGSAANITLTNSIHPKQLQIEIYGKSEIVKFYATESTSLITKEPISNNQSDQCKTFPVKCDTISYGLHLLLSAIQQNINGTRSLENRYRSIHIAHLIHEKIIHSSSKNIFSS